MPRSIEDAVADADWLAHRYDPGHDAVHFRHVPRTPRAAATFLTDEQLAGQLGPAPAPLVVRRSEARAASAPPAAMHFILHSAFCCSTLLARAFELPGTATALKEPVILNDIIGWRRRGGQGPDMAAVLDDALALLARPFAPGEAVIVKPSNAIHALAPAMLTLRPDATALLLHSPLRTYLASVAKKGLEGRLWVRDLLLGLIGDGMVKLGFETRDHIAQTDLQVAAVGWLAQHAFFADLVARFSPARVRTIDSEALTAHPAAAMRALSGLFSITLDADAVAAGPAFTAHSKLGTRFDAADRDAETQDAAALHADEIEKVAVWAETLATTRRIPLALPAPLLA